MLFKGISYLEIWQPFCLAERSHLCNLVEGIQRNNSVKLFEFGSVVQEQMSVIISLICSSGGHHVRKEQNHLCNFEGGHHGEHSYEVI